MTPAARLSAAISILDRWLAGQPAEQALTNWGRASRFAGSGDRAAVRDLVFDAIRCRRSFAALGGAETGRGLILGSLRAQGIDPDSLFMGDGHAPPPVRADEAGRAPQGLEALDCPDWLEGPLRDSLADDFAAVMEALRHRAPVFLRVNAARIDRAAGQAALAAEGIVSVPHHLAKNALEVTENARKIQNSAPFRDGLVELQDAASQAVVEALPLRDGLKVLDLCAGGGGKALAMAARARLALHAHDADPKRMVDLPARAKRAGAKLRLTEMPEAAGPFDLVLADVPCSGSGSWRRAPEGKWRLSPDRLQQLVNIQAQIIDRASKMIEKGGVLAYATCSMLRCENDAQIDGFLSRNSGFAETSRHRFTPLSGGDGFFLAILRKTT